MIIINIIMTVDDKYYNNQHLSIGIERRIILKRFVPDTIVYPNAYVDQMNGYQLQKIQSEINKIKIIGDMVLINRQPSLRGQNSIPAFHRMVDDILIYNHIKKIRCPSYRKMLSYYTNQNFNKIISEFT
jgi:hypothetical protein